MVGFVHFSNFLIPSEKYYNLQSCWITLYLNLPLTWKQPWPIRFLMNFLMSILDFKRRIFLLMNILNFKRMNYFLNEYSGFSFEQNIELKHFLAQFNQKMNIRNISATAIRVFFLNFPLLTQLFHSFNRLSLEV